MHISHSQLIYWSGQCPLEKQLPVLYNDVYFMDTTHHVCVHDLKTGPLKGVDPLGKTCPQGIMQIPQEDGESIDSCLDHLGFNDPNSVARTDAGSGWKYPIEEIRKQVHTEDPQHLHRNATEISGQSGNPSKFIEDVGNALYGFPMNQAGLEAHLDQMLIDYIDTGVKAYIRRRRKDVLDIHLSISCVP